MVVSETGCRFFSYRNAGVPVTSNSSADNFFRRDAVGVFADLDQNQNDASTIGSAIPPAPHPPGSHSEPAGRAGRRP